MIEIYDFGPSKKKKNSFVKKVSDNKQREREEDWLITGKEERETLIFFKNFYKFLDGSTQQPRIKNLNYLI